MRTKLVKGQPFFTAYQYAIVCEGCGVRSLRITDSATEPARVRFHCPACNTQQWAAVKPLPEAI